MNNSYRVQVAHLGWFDYDFGHSTACTFLLEQMEIWLNWLVIAGIVGQDGGTS